MAAEAGRFIVRFWGVRGSIPCPGPDTVRYGGNTSCVEMRCGGRLLIFDGGTGLRPLGQALNGNGPIDADLYFSHTHVDHINGVPFFKPAFDPRNSFRFWAGHLLPERTIRSVCEQLMAAPLFPVPLDILAARIDYRDFRAGETLSPGEGITIRTAPLNHPNGATGYRVEFHGHSVCYVTDTEHRPGELDRDVLGLCRGADLMIYDSTYSDDEYQQYCGWGHSTWQEGTRLAEAAGVGRLVIFHHDPSHDDATMDAIAAAAEAARPGTLVAKEGMTLEP